MNIKKMLSQDYRNLLRKEAKIYSIIQKSFKKQRKYLEDHVKDLYENHVYIINIEYSILQNEHVHLYPEEKKNRTDEMRGDDPMEGFRRSMGIGALIEEMQLPLEKVFERGYKKQYRKFSKLLREEAIDYYPNKPSEYANHRGELNLSNYKGSISHTTKRDVINTLKQGIDNHESRDVMQLKINAIDDKLFGLPRARAIAVTETTKAFEYGNLQPMLALQEAGIQMEKKRLTVGDDRVRLEHQQAEDEGRCDLDYIYPSVGVDMPPGGVNCRCTMQYRRKR